MKFRRMVSDTLTIDDIASMSDQEAVRRRFDMSNIRLLGIMTTIFFVTAIIQLIMAVVHPGSFLLPLAGVHFVFGFLSAAAFGELLYEERQRGKWKPRLPVHVMRRNLAGWVTAWFLIEFAFEVSFREKGHDSWMAWSMAFGFMVVPLRLSFVRRLTIHLGLILILLVSIQIVGTSQKRLLPEIVAISFMNAFALLAGSIASHRMRNETIEEWTERRTSAREQVRMRDELRYAREVQLSMLPEHAPSLDWVDVAGTSLPATEVGGDYFDYFATADGLAIVCGDVAGHGLASGIVLASLRSGFTLLRESLRDPASVLQRLNDLVAQTSRRRMLATAAVVLLDRSSKRATIASAGHPPIIVRRGKAIDSIELFAPPLGVRLPFRVPSREMPFSSGDIFVLHSDGIYESQNAAGESYGLDRLEQIIAATDGADAAAVRDAIIRDVEEFRSGIAQADDVTVVVARVV